MAKLRLLLLATFTIALSCAAQTTAVTNPNQTGENQSSGNQNPPNQTASAQNVANPAVSTLTPVIQSPASQTSTADASPLEETESLLNQTSTSSSRRGFSAYTSTTGSHDSVNGWSTEIDSSVRYDFNGVFGVELGVPYYMSHSGFNSSREALMKALRKGTTVPLTTSYNLLGDAYLKLQFSASNSSAGYVATLSGTAPTGDIATGLSTGRATFDLNNHLEHTWAFMTPEAEIGIGDSSALVSRGRLRPYTTLGVLSHFKAGSSFNFLKIFDLELAGFENLPVGNQKVYGFEIVPSPTGSKQITGKNGVVIARYNVVRTAQGILEDNGLESNLTLNVNDHFALLGTYTRSLRQSYDLVSFGMSFSLGLHKRTLGGL